jgi:hypothetical protein
MPDVDRLPWLTDDVRRPRRSANWVVPFLAASAVAIIAALSFWLGTSGWLRSQQNGPVRSQSRVELPSASSPSAPALPESEPAMPQVEPAPMPRPVAMPEQKDVRVDAPAAKRLAKRSRAAIHRAGTAKAKTSTETKTLKYANPWVSSGVSGRMVRIGAYGSLEKGKKAWSQLAQLSPSFKRLPAVVTDLPSRTGRIYYWLQVGTTSQAHSEVLCQRMRSIGQSCLVVDVVGARKGSKNERQPVGL